MVALPQLACIEGGVCVCVQGSWANLGTQTGKPVFFFSFERGVKYMITAGPGEGPGN